MSVSRRLLGTLAPFVLSLAASLGAFAQATGMDIERLRARAAAGEAAVQAALGGALLHGRGVARDEAEGIKWLRLAAAQGDASGLSLLGYAHLEGRGVAKDPGEGLRLLRQSAGKGFAPAQNALAQLLYRGELANRDLDEAAKWARLSAEKGDREGQRILGAFHLGGHGVSKDLALADAWLRKSAAQGDEEARALLPVVANLRKAESSPEALEKSLAFVRKQAEAGHATSQYQLSLLYERGDGGLPRDQKLAVEWELKAARQDHPEALGVHGTRLMLDMGGVKRDFRKGYDYVYRAGALGHVPSQRLLGMLHQNGEGVKKDIVLGLVWLNAAAATGDARAKEMRDKAMATATPQQVAEAERRAAAFLKRPPQERTTPEGAP